MQLLTPEDVKNDKTNELGKKRVLLASIAEEEARMNRELNQAKENNTVERNRIASEFALFENEMKQRRAELSREVEALESRRSDALKPIENTQHEAEMLLERNKKDEESLREQESVLVEQKNAWVERFEYLKDREQEIADREEGVATKEARARDEAEQLRASQIALSEEWVKFHRSVARANADIEEKLGKIGAERAGIEARRKINEEEALRLTNERRALHDAYLELEQAKKHHG